MLITDDKMAEHLNTLHISSDYTSHSRVEASTSTSMDAEPSTSYSVNLSPKDLERKLKNAQRITLCEQIRKLNNEPLLPHNFYERFDRPCTAMVLWQPPPRLNPDMSDEEAEESHRKQAELHQQQNDNNNSSALDLNSGSSMDMDL